MPQGAPAIHPMSSPAMKGDGPPARIEPSSRAKQSRRTAAAGRTSPRSRLPAGRTCAPPPMAITPMSATAISAGSPACRPARRTGRQRGAEKSLRPCRPAGARHGPTADDKRREDLGEVPSITPVIAELSRNARRVDDVAQAEHREQKPETVLGKPGADHHQELARMAHAAPRWRRRASGVLGGRRL